MTATITGAGLVTDAPATRPTLRDLVARHGLVNGVKWRVLGQDHQDPSPASPPAPDTSAI
jgi:hypothetical protein